MTDLNRIRTRIATFYSTVNGVPVQIRYMGDLWASVVEVGETKPVDVPNSELVGFWVAENGLTAEEVSAMVAL